MVDSKRDYEIAFATYHYVTVGPNSYEISSIRSSVKCIFRWKQLQKGQSSLLPRIGEKRHQGDLNPRPPESAPGAGPVLYKSGAIPVKPWCQHHEECR